MEHTEITSHTGASRIARNPDISQIGGKNTKKITFGYHQRRVLELLAKGGQHSAQIFLQYCICPIREESSANFAKKVSL